MALLDWPGKSATEPGMPDHPALYHMLDVAAVAERLIAPFGFERPVRDALVLLVALHDLGKIAVASRSTRCTVEVVISALQNDDGLLDVPWLMRAGCSKVFRSFVTVRLRAVAHPAAAPASRRAGRGRQATGRAEASVNAPAACPGAVR